ncbi:MAG: hypothetical protein JNJ60_04975 [Rhodocyclaceae bacterium]|nr:hypothetical protein [Rhodocyclaceae bacterium]
MRLIRHLVRLIALVALCTGVSGAHAQAPASFDSLLAQLADNEFSTREAAQRELTERATGAQLSGAQIQRVQAAMSSADLEVSRRATEIFGAFVQSLPSFRAMREAAGVTLTRAVSVDENGDTTETGRFRIDSGNGEFDGPPATSHDNFVALQQAWTRVQQALLAGNAAQAGQALDAYKAVVDGFTPNDVTFLQIGNETDELLQGKDDLLAHVRDARDLLTAFRMDLANGGAADDSALPLPRPVLGAGVLPMGTSLQLSLSAVTLPGSLQLFGFLVEHAPALAPAGYQFVGHVFYLEAQDGLEVAGPIAIDMEFGAVQLIGRPAGNAEALQILRIAGGQAYFLDSTLHDPYHLTAVYDAAPTGADSFGLFGIVEAVPVAPTPWLLAVAAGAGLLSTRGAARRGLQSAAAAPEGAGGYLPAAPCKRPPPA